MPDWKSPQEIQKDATVFVKFVHALLGLYAWEFCLSFGFDWQFISGKKKFRWPLIFYFAGRYLLLFALIGIAIALDTTTEIDCQTLYTFNQLAGDAAVGLASINLSIRTIALWKQNKYIIALLVLIILGHWSLILQGVLLTAVWSPEAQTCVILTTHNTILAAVFIYSMIFDFTVLCLSAWKLLGIGGRADSSNGMKTSLSQGSRLGKMIFADGLVYFFIAFLSNLCATVFMCLNLNQIMSVIFNVPAAVASTIVACRAVRRLTNFANSGAEVYGVSTGGQSHIHIHGSGNNGTSRGHQQVKSGVHVQMETFTRQENGNKDLTDYIRYGADNVTEKNSNRQTVVVMPESTGSDKDADSDIERKGTL